MPLRCAILDDYQNVALTFADWSPLKDKIAIAVFDKPFASQDDAIRALVHRGGNEQDIRARALENGMVLLRSDGVARVLEGETTLDEVLRVTREG